MAHDEEVYPHPLNFDPSRHIGDNPQVDPFRLAFGFGRRVCPGAHLAEMSLFLNIANILSIFVISKAVDENGKEVEPVIEWSNGVTSSVKPSCLSQRLSTQIFFPIDVGIWNLSNVRLNLDQKDTFRCWTRTA